jgi:hypothetical protein
MVKGDNKTKDPLRVIPDALGFHFYTAIGDYCGVSAHSLEEFADALQYVCSEAIVFHFERGDFQNWVRDVIGDDELAKRISDLKICERHLAAEFCRKEIMERVHVRLLQLEANRLVSGKRTRVFTCDLVENNHLTNAKTIGSASFSVEVGQLDKNR